MLRRLYHDQPESFAFTPANHAWAEAQMTKFPEGRQASAIIPLLWRAQEQEGWLSRPAIEHVAKMLGLEYIRALEVATFYFMFQLQPVGSIAHIQVCGTLSCMICGAEDLIGICRDKIADKPHALSEDGKFSWEEVECLGSCANAPMAQIGKDYYEDLTAARLSEIIDELAAGKVPVPGPQNGRYAAEPLGGLTSLQDHAEGRAEYNASVQLATDIGETVKRIDGTEVPLLTPWRDAATADADPQAAARDEMMPPEGPDGKQGGRMAGEKPAPRDRGVSSDGSGEVPGEDGSTARAGKPAAKADQPKGHPGPKAKAHPAPDDTADDLVASSDPDPAPATRAPAPKADAAAAASVVEDAPETLSGPRTGGADDLKRISGVGPKLERTLNELGFYHFDQIAAWTPAQVAWVDSRISFKGRIERDDWIGQARAFAVETK